MRSVSKVKWQICAGTSAFSSSSNGPAVTCRTSTPGASSVTGGGIPGHGPGEDLDLGAAGGHPLRHLDHVNVESTGIAGSGLVERRRMNADRRDPPRDASRH